MYLIIARLNNISGHCKLFEPVFCDKLIADVSFFYLLNGVPFRLCQFRDLKCQRILDKVSAVNDIINAAVLLYEFFMLISSL